MKWFLFHSLLEWNKISSYFISYGHPNKQQTAMTELFSVFKKIINKQINDFFSFCRIHLRYKNRKSQKNVFNYCFFFQFIYCVSIWYVFTEKHDFKQKEKKTIKFLISIQTRTTQIIAKAFKFISNTALEIELHLFSIRQQLDVFIYDALLRIIINFIYEHIRSQRKLSNRAWMLETIQHQRTLYAQLSSLHKFEIRYVTIFKKKHNQFRKSNFFSTLFWWQSSKIIIVSIVEKIVETYDRIMKNNYLTIFTNDSDIKNKIKIFAMTIFISIKRKTSIMMKKSKHM